MTHRGDRRPVSLLQAAAGAVLVLTVEACSGGGGGGGGGSTGSMGGGTSWTPGVYLPGSPAVMAPASLARGASVLSVDGVDAVNANDQASVDTINAGLGPATVGESHTFSILDQGAASPRVVTLQAVIVTDVPVQDVMVLSGTGTNIGYMLFNDQLATSEAALINAVNTLKANPTAITDLVIDIRYNGGGG